MKFPEGGFFYATFLVEGFSPLARALKIQRRKARRRVWHAFQIILLLTQLELLGDRLVTAHVGVRQIIQQAAALADHQQEATAGAVVFLVGLEMFRQMVDALGEQRDQIGRASCRERV